jgi:alpha-glucosidase
MITPKLDALPVYVRDGSILPIQPLVQSTDETPQGPLTLRVYAPSDPSAPCTGEVYTDDGHSFDYKRGDFARVEFTCATERDGSMHVTIAPQQGRFRPWWQSYRIEVYGWTPTQHTARADRSYSLESAGGAWTVTVPADPAGETVQLR